MLFKNYGQLLKCAVEVTDTEGRQAVTVRLARPLQYENSLKVFAMFYDNRTAPLHATIGASEWMTSNIIGSELDRAAVKAHLDMSECMGEVAVKKKDPAALEDATARDLATTILTAASAGDEEQH